MARTHILGVGEIGGRRGIGVLGCLAVPARRFGVVPGNALAEPVHVSQFVLCLGEILVSGLTEPLQNLGAVLWQNGAAVAAGGDQDELGLGFTGLGSLESGHLRGIENMDPLCQSRGQPQSVLL